MSKYERKYYCRVHGDTPDDRCDSCDGALEWKQKDATIATMQARIDSLTAEVEDQARLLGASGSREARLQARIDALTEAAMAVIRWQKANAPGWCLTGVFKSLEKAALEAE